MKYTLHGGPCDGETRRIQGRPQRIIIRSLLSLARPWLTYHRTWDGRYVFEDLREAQTKTPPPSHDGGGAGLE